MKIKSTIGRLAQMKEEIHNGEELKDWREHRGLTQERLAEYLRIRNNTISRWENKTRAIPPYLDLALCEVERRYKLKTIKKKKNQR